MPAKAGGVPGPSARREKRKTKGEGIFPLTQDMEEPSFPTSDDYLETPKQLHYFYGADGALRWLAIVCLPVWLFGRLAVCLARRKFVCVN